jgi:exopolysaccharide biosynthesis polyprenyl glycosylphosphotransferase
VSAGSKAKLNCANLAPATSADLASPIAALGADTEQPEQGRRRDSQGLARASGRESMPTSTSETATHDTVTEQVQPRRARWYVRLGGAGRAPALDARRWNQVRFTIDVLVLYAAAGAAFWADANSLSLADAWISALFPPAVLLLLRGQRASDERFQGSMLDAAIQVLGIVSLASMLVVAATSILGGPHPIGIAVRLWLFGAVYLGISRVVLLSVRRHVVSTEAFAVPTLVVGAGVVGAHLARRLLSEPGYGLRPVGFLDADPLPSRALDAVGPVPVLGGLDSLSEAVRTTGARHVILAFSGEPDHILAEKVRECQRLGLEVSLVPRLYEQINERTTLDHVGGLPLLTLHTVNPRGWQFAIKHAIDFSFAIIVLLIASPAMVLMAIVIRLTSNGPVLFRQRRVGRDGHEFNLLKFRTMRQPVDVDGNVTFVLAQDLAPGGVEGRDRRTGIGRIMRDLSLDELPQLFNVLRGDMSLVGPRPERPEYVERFLRDVVGYEHRHRVRSGITGWAQVHGLRGQTSIADRVEWDNYYIQNWSLWLDLRILALTIAEILRFRES